TSKQNKALSDRESFIRRAHEARSARDLERKQDRAVTTIAAYYHSYVVRRQLRNELAENVKDNLRLAENSPSQRFLNPDEVLRLIRNYLFLYKHRESDSEILDLMCGYIVDNDIKSGSLSDQENREVKAKSYLTHHFGSDTNLTKQKSAFINATKHLLKHCCDSLTKLIAKAASENDLTKLHLTFIDRCISRDKWNWNHRQIDDEKKLETSGQLCRLFVRFLINECELLRKLNKALSAALGGTRPKLGADTLYLAINLSLKSLESDNYSSSMIHEYTRHILSVPCLVLHLDKLSPNTLQAFQRDSILKRVLETQVIEQNSRILINTLEANQALFILGNVIQLAYNNCDELASMYMDFVIFVTRLLECCQKSVLTKQSNLTHWHCIFGWFSQTIEPATHDTLPSVKNQLQYLWSMKLLRVLFVDLVSANERHEQVQAGKMLKKSYSLAKQLEPACTNQKFASVYRQASVGEHQSSYFGSSDSPTNLGNFFANVRRRVIERAASVGRSLPASSAISQSKLSGAYQVSSHNSISSPLATQPSINIGLICNLYQLTLATFTQLKHDILAGLCLHDFVLPNLWRYISSLGPHNGLRVFLEYVALNAPKTCVPGIQILVLFCRCATHLISILDDIEVYEQQRPFYIPELIAISGFLNQFVYRIIWNNLVVVSSGSSSSATASAISSGPVVVEKPANHLKESIDPLLDATHTLLTVLYKRDCRRPFAKPDHWLIKEIKITSFIKDLDLKKAPATILFQKMPHILPHKERVLLFRRYVNNERASLELLQLVNPSLIQSTLITVHRSRVVENGYQQLIRLSPKALKGRIRVKFINDQGLDEAGIDQDGVFKEFLEDSIKRVFDPSLNLFSVTSEQRLYPSPTSHMHEDHLSLFEFVGKMLGKAVYEGIVVDVPFASFFLSQVLGQPLHSALYSSIDELPSLDPELYKSLTYIKHYDGDVSELDLTFSIDQDVMGKIVTFELQPGGKSKPVTRETRVSYIHLVAHFRMHTQIHEQTAAFIRGFRSIINPEWLSMFSTPEFQRLISGDNTPIDLNDLRRNTKYFGGFHNNHRVINWLWDILDKEFSPEEHRLFLKFVTSCSKPPLLGFANLEPPFSIRCVEVSDDQDQGDTFGSVIRGFFAIRRSDPVDRLPTSSTCFNLLKLPNYQRRSTLREKLRYAIKSNPGFELS
ncbi:Ubiquitin-protein ligase E3B, partial [Fragariocoptes setiger]